MLFWSRSSERGGATGWHGVKMSRITLLSYVDVRISLNSSAKLKCLDSKGLTIEEEERSLKGKRWTYSESRKFKQASTRSVSQRRGLDEEGST